ADFTLTTNPYSDFNDVPPDENYMIQHKDAFSLPGNPKYDGTIYIRTDREDSFYTQADRFDDVALVGAAILYHEHAHRLGTHSERQALLMQKSAMEKLKGRFRRQVYYDYMMGKLD